jgi:hypothetical protein
MELTQKRSAKWLDCIEAVLEALEVRDKMTALVPRIAVG